MDGHVAIQYFPTVLRWTCAAVYPLSGAAQYQPRLKALSFIHILRAPDNSRTSRITETLIPTLLPLSSLFGRVTQAHPVVIFVSVIIALVDPLKALFLPRRAASNRRSRAGPSRQMGNPGPAGLVLGTANFVGAAGAPIGLMFLDGALAADFLDRDDEVFAVCMHVRVSP